VSQAVRYLVTGHVQGVGFRWFVSRTAQGLRLVGWVANLPAGEVEVVAAGDAGRLAELEQALRRGPPAAHVARVDKAEYPHEADVGNSFEIR
jgi:acylphosphatase